MLYTSAVLTSNQSVAQLLDNGDPLAPCDNIIFAIFYLSMVVFGRLRYVIMHSNGEGWFEKVTFGKGNKSTFPRSRRPESRLMWGRSIVFILNIRSISNQDEG